METLLQPLSSSEEPEIRQWPPYGPPYEALDYALRPGGWLDAYGPQPDCIKLGAHVDGELVGFSLLVPKHSKDAEFFIAVRGDRIARGLGAAICIETLKLAFGSYGLERVFLKVRKNHEVGIRLYSKVGFVRTGEISEVTNGIPTPFYLMEIGRADFARIYASG